MSASRPSVRPAIAVIGTATVLATGALPWWGARADLVPALEIEFEVEIAEGVAAVEVEAKEAAAEGAAEAEAAADAKGGRAGYPFGDGEPEVEEGQPRTVWDDKPPLTGELMWWDGKTIAGHLVGADGDAIQWGSENFATPADLAFPTLYKITFKGVEEAYPEAPFAFHFRDGSRLSGTIESTGEDTITIRSSTAGQTELRLAEIASVQRLSGGDVVWSGPHGAVGWDHPPGTDAEPARRWHPDNSGHLVSQSFGGNATLPLDFDEPVEISFVLSSAGRPSFSLDLRTKKLSETLVTWEDELVATREGGAFVPLITLGEEDTQVALRLFWNPAAGFAAVCRPNGEVIAQWETSGQGATVEGADNADFFVMPATRKPTDRSQMAASADSGLTLTNRGADLVLEALRIRRWGGDLPITEGAGAPGKTPPGQIQIELNDGSLVQGPLAKSTEAGSIALATVPSIPVDTITRINIGQDEIAPEEPADEGGEEPGDKAEASTVIAQLRGGTSVRAQLLGCEDGKLTLRSPISAKPLSLDAAQLLQLRWPLPPDRSSVPDPEESATVKAGDTKLIGEWVPQEGGAILWRPLGATAPVALRTAEGEDIRVDLPALPEGDRIAIPSLFYLEDGQIVPGVLNGISDDGAAVQFESEITELDEFGPDTITALQFPREGAPMGSVEDSSWTFLGAAEKEESAREDLAEGKLTLGPGLSWGHPSLMAGKGIEFTLQRADSVGVYLNLFLPSFRTNQPGVGSRIAFGFNGSRLYCGMIQDGQFRNHGQANVESGQPAHIRLEWNKSRILVIVNGEHVVSIKSDNQNARRDGYAAVLTTGMLWTMQSDSTISLSELSVPSSPGEIPAPAVVPEAREQALFLPRFRKDSPPGHVLLAYTGDILRGTIESASSDTLHFRSGLEEFDIPGSRTAAAVWLKPPPAEEGEEEVVEEPLEGTWVVLHNGARILLTGVSSYGPDHIEGEAPHLGDCTIPVDLVARISSQPPAPSAAATVLSNWDLVPAPEVDPEGAAEPGSAVTSNEGDKEAAEFELPLLGGGEFKLADAKGKVVVLDFWATWCGPCVRAMPELLNALDDFDPDEVKFVAINEAEAAETIETFLKRNRWGDITVALDSNQTVGESYGVEGIPHTVVIDQAGKIAIVKTGFKPGAAAELADEIRGLLEE